MFKQIDLNKHGLIEASAGTGKTYTIERLFLRILIEKEAVLDSILVVTFTEAATLELKSRIRNLLEKAYNYGQIDDYDIPQEKKEHLRNALLSFDSANIFTIHGFCNKIITKYPFETGATSFNEIYDENSIAEKLIAEQMRTEWKIWNDKSKGFLEEMIIKEGINKLTDLICKIAVRISDDVDLIPLPNKNILYEAGALYSDNKITQVNYLDIHNKVVMFLAWDLRQKINSYKLKESKITYTDMILLVEKTLKQEKSILLNKLRNSYRYGIIDEFQDTNIFQWNIFRRIFMEGEMGKLYVVGDPKQSIFRVQDADVYVYLEAKGFYEKKKENNEAEIYNLNVNYRSSQDIVIAANQLFSQNNWFLVPGILYIPCVAAKNKQEDILSKSIKNISPQKNIILRPLYNSREVETNDKGKPYIDSQRLFYAKYIVQKIIEWHKQGIPYNSFAIIYQTRTYAKVVFNLLKKSGIPYTQYREKGLFSSDEAQNWIYLLEYLVDNSSSNLYKLYLSDFFGVTPFDLVRNNINPLFEKIVFKWLELVGNNKWSFLIKSVLTDTALLLRASKRSDGKRIIASYRQIGEWILKRIINENYSLNDVFKLLKLYHSQELLPSEEEDKFKKETEQDAVLATTIHSSKGLEFNIVFLIIGKKTSRTDIPFIIRSEKEKRREKILITIDQNFKNQINKEEEEEHRRLLYVAFTRAKYKVIIPLWGQNSSAYSEYEKNIYKIIAEKDGNKIIDIDDSQLIKDTQRLKQTISYQRPRTDSFIDLDLNHINTAEKEIYENVIGCNIISKKQFVYSYSSLTHEEDSDKIDYISEKREANIFVDAPLEFVLQKEKVLFEKIDFNDSWAIEIGGKKVGSALHEIIENLDFMQATKNELILETVIFNILNSYGFFNIDRNNREIFINQIKLLFKNLLRLKLPLINGEFKNISDLNKKDCIKEVGFTSVINRGTKLIAESVDNWYFDKVIGFIDLIFKNNKDIYLVDWKSDNLDSYDKEVVCDTINKRGYSIQAGLYSIIYNKWLKSYFNSSGYTLQGICYVFLRGPSAVTIPINQEQIEKWETGLNKLFSQKMIVK